MPRPCAACGASRPGRELFVREMMYGTRHEFAYTECAACESVQIAAVPPDLGQYYGASYYSFGRAPGRLVRFVRGRRAAAALNGGGALGRLLVRRYGIPADLRAVARCGLGRTDRVLDVGCGTGGLLLDLHGAGYTRVAGVDPFIPHTLRYPGGVTVWKQTLDEHDGVYDLIMMHHALEHVPDPLATLCAVWRRLAPTGQLLVRLPVAGSSAARQYGTDWVQLDAPRHLLVPSARGMRALAAAAGFTVAAEVYDSEAFQFWGSELYRRGIPLVDERGRHRDAAASGFAPAELAAFAARARALNAAGDGDQAAFYLRPSSVVGAEARSEPSRPRS